MDNFELKLIDFDSEQLKRVLPTLLRDRTTDKNIIWTTNAYNEYGYTEKDQIPLEAFYGEDPVNLQPRARKSKEEQLYRTRAKAEVFTPAWICNLMNNYADSEWFGRDNVFNTQNEDHTWTLNADKIEFPDGKTWQDYVLDCRLEITCGEAPYLVSRYDTITSDYILPIVRRIGLLDRKLRVVNENTKTQKSWINWAIKAFQSCYGYEYQGDSLLIARINLFLTFIDYYTERWKKNPEESVLSEIADIISWNIWQMDGFSDTIPFGRVKTDADDVLSLFGDEEPKEEPTKPCVIKNWKKDGIIEYRGLKRSDIYMGKKKLFDFVIGNPPYQETTDSDSTRNPPVYNYFMDASYQLSPIVELISPARFLFNAGYTPKAWNEKMLNDKHLKTLYYEQDSSKIFAGTDIKGGIVVTLHNDNIDYGAIGTYSVFPELNGILDKVKEKKFVSLSTIISPALSYKLSELMRKENPDSLDRLRTSCFTTLREIFFEEKPNDSHEYIRMIGILGNKRTWRYVRRDYVVDSSNKLDKYKVILPKSNGSGALGEVLSTPLIGQPLIGQPLIGHTQSFISIGCFDTEVEATACYKYICSKFARACLGILKITQDNPPEKWKYVPLQDFTASSDLDWSKSIHEIDLQLYKKYGLDQQEIDFIEKNVKEMN